MLVGGDSTSDGRIYVRLADDTTKIFISSNSSSYFNGGNVGIGTTSPSNKLTVNQGGGVRVTGITNGTYIELSGDLPGYSANQYPVIKSGGSIHFANNGKYGAYLEGSDTYFGLVDSAIATKVLIKTSGTSYFNGGNVGIGTTSPVANANRNTLALQGACGGQLDIMVGSAVHAQF